MHNVTKLTHTDKGSHGAHWYTIFNPEAGPELIVNRVITAIKTGEKYKIHDETEVFTDPLVRGIIHNNTIITGFPYLKGFRYEQLVLAEITEWSHADNLEAVITGAHISGCALSFFATDYAAHNNIYKTQKQISVNIVGLVYDMRAFNAQEQNLIPGEYYLSEDFCGYIPNGADSIEFVGHIQHAQKHALGEVSGHLMMISITPDFSMEFFIADSHLSIDIESTTHVHGIAWLQGTLEK